MVHINKETCIGCKLCIPYCTMNAILVKNDEVVINQQECVECQVCLRAQVCPTDALYTQELEQARKIREISNPTIRKLTGIPGRGTEEVKTNDVTGRIKQGEIGLCIDVGRPNIGTTIKDVETIAMALAQVGLIFEEQNPCTALMKDSTTGEFNSHVKKQKVLSIIIEGKSTIENIPSIISALKIVEKQVNTVFSVGLICRVGENNRIPVLPILEELGIPVRPNGKTNVGLGKPLIVT